MTAPLLPARHERGAIAWMVHNRVAPNLLMLVLLLGGLFMANNIKKEVFPDFDLDAVNVRNLCNIGVDLTGSRWTWHYQGGGDLDGLPAPFQAAGTCPATFDAP